MSLLIQTLNAFGESSKSANKYANIIANVRASTALDFERIKDALGFLAPTANAAGVSFEKTGAILGVLVDNGIRAARAGRLMSSSFLKLAEEGLTLEDALTDLNKVQQSTTDELVILEKSSSLFGKESAALGLILASNIEKVDDYTSAFEKSDGVLKKLTNTQLESLANKTKILDSAWTEFILSIEDGTGVIGRAASSVIGLATSIVNLGSSLGDYLQGENPFEEGVKYAKSFASTLEGRFNTYNRLSIMIGLAGITRSI